MLQYVTSCQSGVFVQDLSHVYRCRCFVRRVQNIAREVLVYDTILRQRSIYPKMTDIQLVPFQMPRNQRGSKNQSH
jgi:hypothetical protein